MNERDMRDLDEMGARFGRSLSEEEIARVLAGIRKKIESKY